MHLTRASCGAARVVLWLALAAAFVVAVVAAPRTVACAVENRSSAPVTTETTTSDQATEPFLPFSGSADAEGAVIPGGDGEQYLVLLLAAVFFFIGLGYRLIALASDIDRRE